MTDITELLIRYEQGETDEEELLLLFAGLIRSGLHWSLPGHYGRTARYYIESGQISPDDYPSGDITWEPR